MSYGGEQRQKGDFQRKEPAANMVVMKGIERLLAVLSNHGQYHRSNDGPPNKGVGETACKLKCVHSELRRSLLANRKNANG